ncbi:MAG: hypothetical protein EON54_24305, partial [Alcaligenaceae bacterium]
AGFLLARFGNLPAMGESIELSGFRFEITEVENRRIAVVSVSRVALSAALQPAATHQERL